jgi:hypothetical protein
MVWSEDQQRMEQKVKTMICRFGGCCTKGLNCPWLHTLEETQIFKDELALRQRKLAVRCGFCARGECRFGAACERTQRAVTGGGVVGESVVSTDSVIDGSKVYEFGSDGDARTSQCGRCSDDATGGGSDFSFSVAGAAAEDEWKFEKGWIKKFRVARRSVAKAGGFGVASVYGPLATAEEDMVEEPVNIMFIPPKPRVKSKTKGSLVEVAEVAADAVEAEAVDGAAEAAEVAAEAAVRAELDFEFFSDTSIWSDHIDVAGAEAAAAGAAAEAATEAVELMEVVEAAGAEEAAEETVEFAVMDSDELISRLLAVGNKGMKGISMVGD